ncbi:MAG: hypothetical protein JKX85_15405 [Phycisphaeraceae bacterium]|nr:hypothetical protein [Phycisphaeraceae bacterium]
MAKEIAKSKSRGILLEGDPMQASESSSQKEQTNEKHFWIKPARGLEAFVRIDASKTLGPINRHIFGAGLLRPPMDQTKNKVKARQSARSFGPKAIEASKAILAGSSVRIWLLNNTRTYPDYNKWWIDFVERVKPSRSYIFTPISHADALIRYTSEKDNNLYPQQQPYACAARVRQMNKTAYPGHPNGLGIQYWELWNEPRFRQNGGWDPIEYARYCIDAARRMKQVDPTLKIGSPIHGDVRDQWNQTMLAYLGKHGTQEIDFIVNHYYDTKWTRQWDIYGSYLGRVGYSSEIRQRVQRDRQAIERVSGGKWKLTSSEWNTHPRRYDWPGETTHDLAVALFQASTLQAFVEEGLDAAQVFMLRNRTMGLFDFANGSNDDDNADLKIWPTYEVFKLYASYYTGQVLTDKTTSPTFIWNWHTPQSTRTDFRSNFRGGDLESRHVPYVDVIASRKDKKNVTLMVVNKHPDQTIYLNVALEGVGEPTSIEMTTLTGKDKEAAEADLIKTQPAVEDPLVIALPPHSFSAIRIKLSELDMSKNQQATKLLRFIKKWRVGKLITATNPADHGLAEDLSLAVIAEPKTIELKADRTGYVNLSTPLKISREALKKASQAVATSWVFSPVQQKLVLGLGLDFWGVLYVNGQPVLRVTDRKGSPQPNTHRVKTSFHVGWNRLDVRVASGSGGMGFWLAIENNGDLLFNDSEKKPVWPVSWHITSDQSGYVSKKKSKQNKAQPDASEIALSGAFLNRAFIHWPTSPLPQRVLPRDLAVRFVLPGAICDRAGRVWIRPVLESWDRSFLTYNHQPKLGKPIALKPSVVAQSQWVFESPAAIPLIRRWLRQPSLNYGLAVESDVENLAVFHRDNVPRLELRLEIRKKRKRSKKRQ